MKNVKDYLTHGFSDEIASSDKYSLTLCETDRGAEFILFYCAGGEEYEKIESSLIEFVGEGNYLDRVQNEYENFCNDYVLK